MLLRLRFWVSSLSRNADNQAELIWGLSLSLVWLTWHPLNLFFSPVSSPPPTHWHRHYKLNLTLQIQGAQGDGLTRALTQTKGSKGFRQAAGSSIHTVHPECQNMLYSGLKMICATDFRVKTKGISSSFLCGAKCDVWGIRPLLWSVLIKTYFSFMLMILWCTLFQPHLIRSFISSNSVFMLFSSPFKTSFKP